MSVNHEVREILNIGHKELRVKRFQKLRQVCRKILEDNYVSEGRPLQQCKEKQKKYNSQPRSMWTYLILKEQKQQSNEAPNQKKSSDRISEHERVSNVSKKAVFMELQS